MKKLKWGHEKLICEGFTVKVFTKWMICQNDVVKKVNGVQVKMNVMMKCEMMGDSLMMNSNLKLKLVVLGGAQAV